MIDHPKTFDEIIEQGFPLDKLRSLADAHQDRVRLRPAPIAPATRLAPAIALTTRENQSSLSAVRQTAFRNAIAALVREGKYLSLIQDHMDMSHNMHGSMGEVGLYRFLAWHRRYLVECERELQRVDAILRPSAVDPVGIPYWRWQDPFPTWLVDFLPANNPDNNQKPPARKNASPPSKANAADIDIIVNQFSIQQTGLSGENNYTKFTYAIEGFGRRHDGSSLPAHNHGHAWIGGIMNNSRTSPTDPMFWLHHAEIDRLWEVWRQANATPRPNLSDTDLILDPWAESYDEVLDITALGYSYDSMAL